MDNVTVSTRKTITATGSGSIPAKDLRDFLNDVPDDVRVSFKEVYGDRPGELNTLTISVNL